MPAINVQLLEGRTSAQKSALIAGLARVTVEALGVPEEAVRIILTEVSPDHWGIGGRTMAELKRGAGPAKE